jgi:phospholipid transport system substrate-binding protein
LTLWKATGIGLLILFSHVSTWAAESPTAVVRSTIEQATAVLQDPAYQGAEHRQVRMDKIREIVLPHFDPREIARRTLGIHWHARTEEQRREFIQLFITLVEQTYSSTLDRYTGNVRFVFDRQRIEGTFAEVQSRVFDPSLDKTFSVNYRLHQVDGKWLVYDVVLENISMVRNYRTQFNRIITKSSYEELVQSIQRKLQQLASSPS